jgi:transposase
VAVFLEARRKYPSLRGVCGDAGYRGAFAEQAAMLGCAVDISERVKPKEWETLPKRWRVERTFSWLNNSRRLSKDYEISILSEESMVMISHIHTLLQRY